MSLLRSLRNNFLSPLFNCNGSIGYEDFRSRIVDNGSSHHMIGILSIFLNISGIDSNCYVDSGVNNIHVVRLVGCIRFHLESRGF